MGDDRPHDGPDDGPAERPRRPTLAQLRAVAQPPEIRSRVNSEHWTAQLFLRHGSIYLTRLLVRTPITANGVTLLNIACGWAAAASLLIPGLAGGLLAVFFALAQMYVDCCDGEVARWRGTSSPSGVFLDKLGHYTTEGLVGLAVGLRAVGDLSGLGSTSADSSGSVWFHVALGAILGWGIVLNKTQNDLVHVARAFFGMPRLGEDAGAKAVPVTTVLGRLRRIARFVPFYRAFHSVELSMLSLLATIVSLAAGVRLLGEHWLLYLAAAAIVLANLGHGVAILASPRVRPPDSTP